ncbi:uncharacterized protein LOC127867484 isoform X2 [Dreissena polymorpha]|uniref:uncharacterized protein LOC127867484 isoform X2 n=1 Tax=Dreissena polymorpha TaxID=45954 RepID=UPI002264F1D1|nr:uncharacterized protein LOC127867484 isoform X2 [Dreissena polymorpha]
MVKIEGEVYPLLTTDWLGTPTYRQKPVARYTRHDDTDEQVQVFEDDEEVFDIIDQKKKRSVNKVWGDVFLLALDFLQIFALIQSMSTRWLFPEKWLRKTYWVFGFNADAWEIVKFTNESVYHSVQGADIASSKVPLSYEYIVFGWFGLFGALTISYGALHLIMWRFFYPQTRQRMIMSWIQYFTVIVIHILSFPFGTALFRVFQCEGEFNKVYTVNDYGCFSSQHWKLGAPALLMLIVLFILYPAFLIIKIRREGMTGTSKGYLSFILMKETEYKIHLNRSWLHDSMWIFSSFKHRGRYYYSALLVAKLLLLIIFVAAFNNIKIQSMVTAIFLLVMFLSAVIVRPFRLTSCNAFLAFSILCNLGNAFVGSLLSNYNSYTTPSAWLTPNYIIWFIGIIQVSWLVSLISLLVYLVSRTLCHSTKSCYKRPVWPNIASSGEGYLTTETKKFMTAIIKAKIAHENIQRVPAIFAPVHELARHIHVINTYCREAEYVRDPLHLVLWEILDDLVESHANLSPKSLFADSVKKSIRRTAAEFMKLAPMFSQRLAQRDFDLILVPPVRRRLLLKMYILGVFLNGRSERVAKRNLLQPATEKVWPSLQADRLFEEEDGYFEDLYPAPIGGNYSDDLLQVINEDSTDAESTEEEDNVQGMLRKLPEVGLIDLETPTIGGVAEELDSEEEVPVKLPGGKQGASFGHMKPVNLQPLRSGSASSIRSTESVPPPVRPGSGASSLFGSHASLRRDVMSPQLRNMTSPLQQGPGSNGSGRSLSPVAPPGSSASQHSGRGPSPVRPASGSSVISSQPSRPMSADSGREPDMAAINPGYVPDPEEESIQGRQLVAERAEENNPAFNEDYEESQEEEIAEVASSVSDVFQKK